MTVSGKSSRDNLWYCLTNCTSNLTASIQLQMNLARRFITQGPRSSGKSNTVSGPVKGATHGTQFLSCKRLCLQSPHRSGGVPPPLLANTNHPGYFGKVGMRRYHLKRELRMEATKTISHPVSRRERLSERASWFRLCPAGAVTVIVTDQNKVTIPKEREARDGRTQTSPQNVVCEKRQPINCLSSWLLKLLPCVD
jgi:hypothetical protein